MKRNMEKFDKNKYLGILKSQDLHTALTVLHQDMWNIEFDTFEGQEGWQPKKWDSLTQMRQFSRELWEHGLELQHQKDLASSH